LFLFLFIFLFCFVVKEMKSQQLLQELTDLKIEFQRYKARANAALQQSSSSQTESRIAELEGCKSRLEKDLIDKKSELEITKTRVASLETDLRNAIDQISLLEGNAKRLDAANMDMLSARDEVALLNKKLEHERENHNEGNWKFK